MAQRVVGDLLGGLCVCFVDASRDFFCLRPVNLCIPSFGARGTHCPPPPPHGRHGHTVVDCQELANLTSPDYQKEYMTNLSLF